MRKGSNFLRAMTILVSLGASTVLAGEITGTGESLHTDAGKWGTGLYGRSLCAYSGQEDLQYDPYNDPTAGHAQSWGQIPKDFRDFLVTIALSPGIACNPTRSTGE